MNAQQKQLNNWVIKNNMEEIARIEKELQNPRIRKVESRKQHIEDLKLQIEQAKHLLESA